MDRRQKVLLSVAAVVVVTAVIVAVMLFQPWDLYN